MHNHLKKNFSRVGILVIFMLMGCGPNENSAELLEPTQIVVKGQELYLGHGCAVCHGKEGRGDGPTAQGLYPLPIDFHDASAYRQGNSVKSIQRSIRYGMRQEGSPMPVYEHLSNEELKYIAEFVKSLQDSGKNAQSQEKDL